MVINNQSLKTHEKTFIGILGSEPNTISSLDATESTFIIIIFFPSISALFFWALILHLLCNEGIVLTNTSLHNTAYIPMKYPHPFY